VSLAVLYRLALPGHKAAPEGGAVLAQAGRHGRDADALWDPEGLALDEDGVLYVADSGNHRISAWSVAPPTAGSEKGDDAHGEPNAFVKLRTIGSMGFADGQASADRS